MRADTDPIDWAVHHALVAVRGQSVADAVGRCLLDWSGCLWAGVATSAARAVTTVASALGHGPCRAAGVSDGASAFAAALINGTASHAIDYDDTEMTFVGHPGVVVIPAVLAVCEERALPWSRFDGAVAVGYQLAALLGLAAQPAHQERGWHTTATLGTLVAAGAAAYAMAPDPTFLAGAMRVAATQAGGVVGVFGTDAKAFQAGRAAASGILAAQLADAGLSVPTGAVAGPSGYAAASTGTWRTPSIPHLPLAVAAPTVKLHAACRSTHCTIDAVHQLSAQGLLAERITALDIRIAPRSAQAAGTPNPATAQAAKFSVRHVAALAAVRGPIDEAAFSDGVWDDPRVLSLRERITVVVDERLALPDEPACAVAIDRAGRRHEVRVDAPVGSPAHPLPAEDLVAKFERLVSGASGRSDQASTSLNAILVRPWAASVDASAFVP